MKTIKTSMLLLLAVVLATACSSDDDNGPGNIENQPPGAFDLLIVPDQATKVDLEPGLSWSESTDPDGDAVTYSLYLGANQGNMDEIATNLTNTAYQLEERLLLTTEYFWKVVALDGNGGETESQTHGFTTRKINDAIQTSMSTGFSASTEIHTVVFDGKLWAIGGNYGNTPYKEVWHTTDGVSWTQGPDLPSPRYYHQTLVYDGKMWVLFGHNGTSSLPDAIYSSNDGMQWTLEGSTSAPERYDHTALVFDGKMWVIGGTSSSSETDYKNDVWFSTDGINWTEATPNAAFSPRRNHTSVVYDGKMWVIGGNDAANGLLNDVWYSTDGVTWTEATPNAAFPARGSHVSEVYGGKMWVISGDKGGTTEINDVWSSTDGVNWTEVYTNAAFTPRRYAGSAVFDDKLWIIAGFDNVNGYVYDVWYLE